MANTFTITRDTETKTFTIERGVGRDGSDASVTLANVRAAVPNMVEVASPANDDMIQRVGGSWVTRTIAQVRTALGLGSAAYTASTAYATAAQGAKADRAALVDIVNTFEQQIGFQQGIDDGTGGGGQNFIPSQAGTLINNNSDQIGSVKSSSFTAATNGIYTVTATATATDPITPVEGQGFTVIVRNGTATVGGTAYATAGTIIRRIYHSGSYTNYVYKDLAQLPADLAATITAATSKATPVDADELPLADSAASFGLKKLTWANLKATAKTYFDTLYVALTGNQTVAGDKTFSGNTAMTGNLTVDTNTLFVDATNNRVGIGTTSPAAPLHVVASGNVSIVVDSDSGQASQFQFRSGNVVKNIIGYDGANGTRIYDGVLDDSVFYSTLGSGLVGILTTTATSPLDVNGNRIRIRTAKTPSSASDTGNAGEICWDSSYIYVCTATNTWKRVAISTW